LIIIHEIKLKKILGNLITDTGNECQSKNNNNP